MFGKGDQMITDSLCGLILSMGKFYFYGSKVQKNEQNTRTFLREIYNRYCVEQKFTKTKLGV